MSDDREKDFYERNDNGYIKVRPATDFEWTNARRRSWLDEYIESNRSTVTARQRDLA